MRSRTLALTTFIVCLTLLTGTPGGSARADEAWVFTTVAGVPPGSADGVGSAARFYYPSGSAVDSAGNVYVADHGNHCIRKITPTGVVSVWAGLAETPGSQDGNRSTARFDGPNDVALDASGNMYVADAHTYIIRKIAADGTVTTLAGLAGQAGPDNGTGSQARFQHPSALTVDTQGNVYVADENDHTIRKVTPAGVVTTFAGRSGTVGSADGSASVARFWAPSGIEIDASGNLYVADSYNGTIRKVTPGGVVSTFAGAALVFGSNDGTGGAARFARPVSIAVDASGNVFVADDGNHNIRRITSGRVVSTLAGNALAHGSVDGTGTAARFYGPYGVSADSQGNLFVSDNYNQTLRKVTPAGVVTTVAGLASAGSDDGGIGVARFDAPTDVELDAGGNLVVTDSYNNTVRTVTPGGNVTTLAGLAGASGSANGQGSAARFNLPSYLAIGPGGDVYVSDQYNFTVRRITPDGTVSILAGSSGQQGSADASGAAASFGFPAGMAIDGSGNVIVADRGNSTIRKITPAGAVSTIAGGTGLPDTVDGTGNKARFDSPIGLAIANDGNIFVADFDGATLRKVTPAGAVTTVAGLARSYGNVDGTGSEARFDGPEGVAVDAAGNVLIGDVFTDTIRKVTQAGVVTTLAGTAYRYGFNSGLGADARFDGPAGMDVDANGVIYLADRYTNTIRRGVKCTTGAICSISGRFELTITARDPRSGATGPGVPLQQNDLFGFFSIPALTGNKGNPEVFVKLLDGRGVNGNFWVFYGGLTDFEYTLTVKDTVSGTTKSYTKPGGTSNGGFDVGSGVTPESCAGNVTGTPQPAVPPAPCSAGSDKLCLNGGRFKVAVAARDPRTGNQGPGVSIPQSDLFGYFSIPALTGNPSNPEVFVKVLDGRVINGYYWIFFSGLTDLEYTMTVTDTETGTVKSYTKAGGSACGAFDTKAF
ncbi:MAG: NHL repeat-containing protein [Thermoanaerobaculia bacterium]|jgi:sugar lactone lactonase YvrE